MIHVDVRRKVHSTYEIQTSVDGSAWKTHYTVYPQVGQSDEETKSHADFIARVFMDGMRFAGARTRGTSCGYSL